MVDATLRNTLDNWNFLKVWPLPILLHHWNSSQYIKLHINRYTKINPCHLDTNYTLTLSPSKIGLVPIRHNSSHQQHRIQSPLLLCGRTGSSFHTQSGIRLKLTAKGISFLPNLIRCLLINNLRHPSSTKTLLEPWSGHFRYCLTTQSKALF
ncbi:hypothetical protein GDO78_016350 [Eleutherodactylus coqui]|uniref:Uncharacterized protein n=1 Tax=Eleutherodactylus coqui TaxID=57060 RepID=A0A8J6B9R2_ELECQ|nr:hypothetical protein GDO78_016350 [Eleutherodactylus coqui]